jgi:integrase
MPYKDRGRWRGVVKIAGKRVAQQSFRTKREAAKWERETKNSFLKRTLTGSLGDVINDYLSYVKIEYIHSTYMTKRRHMKRLILKVEPSTPLVEITSLMIWNYLKEVSPASSFNRHRKELMAFFNYAILFHDLPSNPLVRIKPVPVDSQPEAVFTEDEFIRLMMAADRHGRNLLVIYGTTGARRNELFRLTWTDDINFDERTIRLGTRKSRDRSMKYRYVPINDMAFDALQDQWKTRLPLSDYVFQNREQNHSHYGGRYTTRRRFVRGLCKKAGIEKKGRVGFHAIRRMFASLLADKHKQSIPTIQKLLGHSSPSTTDRYIHKIQNDTKIAVENLSFETPVPRAVPQNKSGDQP